MSQSAAAIHVVRPETAWLLDRVDEDVFDHEVRPELLREFLANPSNVLVLAVADEVVVGMATDMICGHPDKPLSLFIDEVGVSGRLHRRGIGRHLARACWRGAGSVAAMRRGWPSKSAMRLPGLCMNPAEASKTRRRRLFMFIHLQASHRTMAVKTTPDLFSQPRSPW
jgi:hypothetical protein